MHSDLPKGISLVISQIKRSAAIGLLGVSIAACTPVIGHHGQTVDPDGVKAISPGQTSKTQVLALLGAPSSEANFNEDIWYYISEKRETKAFFAPVTLERHVVFVRFDPNGAVEAIGTLGKDDGKEIVLISRKTPTAGQEITIMKQLLGNLGRFNEETKN